MSSTNAQKKQIQLTDGPKREENSDEIVDNPETSSEHLQSKILETNLSNFVKDYQILVKEKLMKKFAPDFIKTLVNKRVIKPLSEDLQVQLNQMIEDNSRDHTDKLQAYLRTNIIQSPSIVRFQTAKEQKKIRIAQKLQRIRDKVSKIEDKMRRKKWQEQLVKFTEHRDKNFKRFEPNYQVEQILNYQTKKNERLLKQRQENLRKSQEKMIQSLADQIYKLDFKSFQKQLQG